MLDDEEVTTPGNDDTTWGPEADDPPGTKTEDLGGPVPEYVDNVVGGVRTTGTDIERWITVLPEADPALVTRIT